MVTEEWIWTTFQVIVGYNLFMPFLLYCCWRLITSKRNTNIVASREPDYAIIVTAYEQTDSLYAVVDSISRLNYSNYIVYVVADNCDVTDLIFPDNRVMLLHPPETIASNTGSHFYAIRNFVRKHERLTIIDSDNLVHPEYLNELNRTFSQGFEAVQGVRKAKNLNSTLACLDAARDIYYNFYDGKLLFGLGSSATLAGSGMAFTVALYGRCLQDSSVSGAGFDKVLQAEIVGANERIAFCERAWVYDEKTSGSDQLVNQRARWISTWFRFFQKDFVF
ncbi:glycosyltransferase [Arcticibacter sp. MXS-1]|uniref:glycosyltransferase n=1 Tax=Arcticibacter sp. MXS-1 TaxID=3341726 RepID=UPI0035A87184